MWMLISASASVHLRKTGFIKTLSVHLFTRLTPLLSNICRPPSSAISPSTSWSRTPWSAQRQTWRSSGEKARGNTHPSTRSRRTRWGRNQTDPDPNLDLACRILCIVLHALLHMKRIWQEYNLCPGVERCGEDSFHDNHIPVERGKKEVCCTWFSCRRKCFIGPKVQVVLSRLHFGII